MRKVILRCRMALGLATVVLLSACARTEPARFYLLRPLAASDFEQPRKEVGVSEDWAATLGVEPVELAAYLNRPEIATRRGPYQVRFAEFDRWAEPLDENIAQVLADNLSRLLHSRSVQVLHRAAGIDLDYRLSVYLLRFDNEPGEGALLQARWTLWDDDESEPLITREDEYREPLQEQDYDLIAAAGSRLVASLSRDIAETVVDLLRRGRE